MSRSFVKLLQPYNVPGQDYEKYPPQHFEIRSIVSRRYSMKKTIIFGHDGGLSQMFRLGYHIDAMYHQNHPHVSVPIHSTSYLKDNKTLLGFFFDFMSIFNLDVNLNQLIILLEKFEQNPTLYRTFVNVLRFYVFNFNNINQTFKTDSESQNMITQISDIVTYVMNQILDDAEFQSKSNKIFRCHRKVHLIWQLNNFSHY